MKFIGYIGFWNGDAELSPDVYKADIVEKQYICESTKQVRRFQSSGNQNDNINVTNTVSILSDIYSKENWSSIRYIVINNVAWNVNSVEMNYPRLTLELGGIYNNERPSRIGDEAEGNTGIE